MINYRKFELNNGLEIYFSNVPHRNDIGIYVMCRVGSNYERKRLNGMSHFLEHMCFKGTNTRTKSDIIDYFAKDPIGSHGSSAIGFLLNISKILFGRYFLSTTTS